MQGILSYFPYLRIESVHFCKNGSFQRPRFTAIGGYLKKAKSFGNFCDVVVPEGRVYTKPGIVAGGIKSTYNLWFK